MLQKEQGKKQAMVQSLSKKEKQLKKELEEKNRIALQIEQEIARIIRRGEKKSNKI